MNKIPPTISINPISPPITKPIIVKTPSIKSSRSPKNKKSIEILS